MRWRRFRSIGAVIGALWCVCGLLPLPDMLKAAGFCLIPVAATGGIHLDGFADTSDALSSYGDREKKLAILKDPHCGAFAVIRLCGYFVAVFRALRLSALYAARGRGLDAGARAGTRLVRLCGCDVPDGEEHGAGAHVRHGGG